MTPSTLQRIPHTEVTLFERLGFLGTLRTPRPMSCSYLLDFVMPCME